jgi:hypothetical protein
MGPRWLLHGTISLDACNKDLSRKLIVGIFTVLHFATIDGAKVGVACASVASLLSCPD